MRKVRLVFGLALAVACGDADDGDAVGDSTSTTDADDTTGASMQNDSDGSSGDSSGDSAADSSGGSSGDVPGTTGSTGDGNGTTSDGDSSGDDDTAASEGTDTGDDSDAYGPCEDEICPVSSLCTAGAVGGEVCSPACGDADPCPDPATGDASPMCVPNGPGLGSFCALLCNVGTTTCPDGMSCSPIEEGAAVGSCVWE